MNTQNRKRFLTIILPFILILSCYEQETKLTEEQITDAIVFVAYPDKTVEASTYGSSKELYIIKAKPDAEPVRISYTDNWEEQPVWVDNGNSLVFMRCIGRYGSGREKWYLYKKKLFTGKENRLMEVDATTRIKSAKNLFLFDSYLNILYVVDTATYTLIELLTPKKLGISSSKKGGQIYDFSMDENERRFALAIAIDGRLKGKTLVKERFKCNEIAIVNHDGSDFQILTNDSFPDGSPAMSPDGASIAFESKRDGNSEVYLMEIATKQIKRITNHPAHDHSPAWSSDGKKIAFISERDRFSHIWIINTDGTGIYQLTKGRFHVWSGISWSPK